jgi:hypothetical protein
MIPGCLLRHHKLLRQDNLLYHHNLGQQRTMAEDGLVTLSGHWRRAEVPIPEPDCPG